MAVFNPAVAPTNDPNYLGYSRGTSQPDANKALGTAVAGIGNLLEAGVKVADTVVKEKLKDRVYNIVEGERDAFTSSLEQTQIALRGPGADPNVGVDPASGLDAYASAAPATTADSLVQTPTELPSPLQTIQQRAGTLKAAYEKGLPYSAYYGRLRSLAKELRTEYPGYKDYIDSQFSKILGTDPANAYIRAQVANINAAMAGQNAAQNKVLSSMFQHLDIPGMNDEIEHFQRTGDQSRAIKFLNENLTWKYERERRKDELDKVTENRALQTTQAQDFAVSDVHQTAVKFFQTVNRKMGLTTPKDVEAYLTKVSAGESKLTDVQGKQLIQYLTEIRNQAFNEKYREYHQFRKDDAGNNYTIAGRLGGSKATTDKINEGLVLFDNVIARLSNKQDGLAYFEAQKAEAIEAGTRLGLYEAGAFGKETVIMKELQKAYPQAAQKYLESLMAGQNRENVDKAFQTFLNSHVTSAITQKNVFGVIQDTLAPPAPNQPAVPGRTSAPSAVNPVTLNSIFNDAQRKKVSDPGFYKTAPERIVNFLTDPSNPPELKRNAAVALFDPSNRNHLAFYNKEFVDDKGRTIPGRYSIWSKVYTSPAVAKSMFDLGATYPEIAKTYTDTVKTEFAHQLWSSEINELTELRLDKRLNIVYNNDPNSPDFGFRVSPVLPPSGLTSSEYSTLASGGAGIVEVKRAAQQAQVILDRLNVGIRGLHNVSAAAGNDPKATDAFVLELLKSGGFNPNKQPTFPLIKSSVAPESPIEAMGRALVSANTETPTSTTPSTNKRTSDAPKANTGPSTRGGGSDIAHYTEEELMTKPQSIADWISSLPKDKKGKSKLPEEVIEVLGMDIQDIPLDMTAQEFIRKLGKK